MPDTRGEYQELLSIYWPIGVGVFVLVFVLVLFVVIRFRSDSEEFPQGRDKSTPVEALYVTFLACVAAGLLYFTLTTNSDVTSSFGSVFGPSYSNETAPRSFDEAAPADASALEVRVTGARWNWSFEYPREGVTLRGTDERPATLVVPAGRAIAFEGTSIDVVHSFWIPYLRFKRDVVPERVATWALAFDQLGFHPRYGECAEFCGLRHSNMEFNVDVLEPAEFESWLGEQRAASGRDATVAGEPGA